MRSMRECVFIALPIGRHRMAASGAEGWRWMAKSHAHFISISGLIGVLSMVTADVRQG
jgi:hypothetical protein